MPFRELIASKPWSILQLAVRRTNHCHMCVTGLISESGETHLRSSINMYLYCSIYMYLYLYVFYFICVICVCQKDENSVRANQWILGWEVNEDC